ncbi:MAG: multiheme c-type cytochrome [Pirellulaceae bacterium]|nr:multiheme c-type cytochrome [Pirellulaceae bacterium]
MSKSRRPRPTAEPNVPPQSRRPLRTAPLVAGTIVVLAGAGLAADWYFGLPAEAQATFVGRESCATCHQPEHTQWTGSHHDLAMEVATDKSVLGDFNNAELTHHGTRSRMFRQDGKFYIHTEGPDGKLADFEIKYTFGVDPLQQYMVEFDRPADMPAHETARLQVLRVSWDTQKKRWFHLDPPDVKEKLAPDDDLHWTGIAQRWNNMCADCHSTNLHKNFDVATAIYHTTWSEIDVSCEACHGPGSLHVKLAEAPSLFWDRERGYALAKLKGKENTAEIQACAPCHSRRRMVQTGYTAGCNYYDYFSNELLTQSSYHADGQILDEVYEFGSFIQSKMYHKGIRCTDCHNPHTAQTKFSGNQLCTSCHQHPAPKYDSFAHHRHPTGSKGASCVECHMPQTTYMQVDPRRDHSLRVPRPDLSVNLGTPNACTGCHLKDKLLPGGKGTAVSVPERPDLKEYADWLRVAGNDDAVKARLAQVDRWADETLDQWYGDARKREPHFAPALAAARQQSADAPQKLLDLLANEKLPAIARGTAAQELGAYFDTGPQVGDRLAKSIVDPDPQPRGAAVASLERAELNVLRRSVTPALLPAQPVAVRGEAGRVLSRIPQTEFGRDDARHLREAIKLAFAAAEIDNDRAGGHLIAGFLHENLGAWEAAETAYRTGIRIEPTAVGPRANLARLLEQRLEGMQQEARQLAQRGQVEQAQQLVAELGPLYDQIRRLQAEELGLLERDGMLAPDNAPLQNRIGLLRYLQGWRKEAETALLNAWLLEPRTPDFGYALAIFYRDTGRPEQARPLVRRLLELRPDDPMIRQFAEELGTRAPAGPPR